MLEMYWSKYGSMTMTSSPGSTKPMKADRMPSFAPVVTTISAAGSSVRPKNGE